jgi:predicted transcriptional regulator
VNEAAATLQRRADVLELLTEQPREKASLTAALPASRSTVDRAVRELASHGFVVRKGGDCIATAAGRAAFDAYRGLDDRLCAVERAERLLRYLPPDAPLDAAMLTGADLAVATPPATYQPSEELKRRHAGADRIRGISKAIAHPGSSGALAEAVLDHGTTYESVETPGIVEHLLEHRAEERRRMVETGRYRVFVVDGDRVPYGLFVHDRPEGPVASVVVYEASETKGVISTETGDGVAWAAERFESVRADATEITDRFRG